MKVTLVNPTSSRGGLANKDVSGGFGTVSQFGGSFVGKLLTMIKKRGISYPLLSFGYASGIFNEAGWEVAVADNAEGVPPSDLVIVCGSLIDFRNERETAKKIKQRLGGSCSVGFMGPFVTVCPEQFDSWADFVIIGEPEKALMEIAAGKLKPLGRVESPLITDLDTLPFPDWSPFAGEFSYFPYFWGRKNKKNFFPIQSSRGCSFSCEYYCPYPAVGGRKWRHRSPENVVDEIQHLIEHNNAGFLLFRDPIFSLDKKRTAKIAQEIIDRKLKLNYVVETHLNCLDEELIDLLYRSGLRSIKVGIESADKEVMEATKRKPIDEDHQKRIIRYCETKKIAITAFYIFALMDDTEETIRHTISYACSLNTVGAQFTICTPYPGTAFYRKIKKIKL